MSEPAIQIRGLGKKYRLGANTRLDQTLPEAISHVARRVLRACSMKRSDAAVSIADAQTPQAISKPAASDRDLWALRDVDLDIAEGEVVGIVGRNGAGKSTLLKLLSEITGPTEGDITMRGRVASLLEVGTGFHPELTGRENIYLNGSILGMKRSQIRERFDDIVEFSGVKRFLDTPVKRYSSGMTVRLAFAVAAHLEPEILIIDEVLAVGDAEFQRRCLGKMRDVAGSGRTVLFVSHNLGAVQSLCSRAVLLQQGRLVADGDPESVIHQYLQAGAEQSSVPLNERTDRQGRGGARLTDCRVTASHADNAPPAASVNVAGSWGVTTTFTRDLAGSDYALQIGVFAAGGNRVAFVSTDQYPDIANHWPTAGSITLHFDQGCILWPGVYSVNVALLIDGRVCDFVQNATTFEVTLGESGVTLPGRFAATLMPTGTFRIDADEPMQLDPAELDAASSASVSRKDAA